MEGRRASSVRATAEHVSKKLCFTIVLFVGVMSACAGYVLGNIAHNETRRSNDIVSFNLSTASELLFKKAKRISPKVVNNYNPDKISARIIEIFHSDCADCGTMKNYDIFDFIKTVVNHEASKFIRAMNNASLFVDSLS